MENDALPVFRYHPDPVATGSIVAEADMPCLGCNRIRGYIYKGPVYTEKNFILNDHLCPWCIADGTAAKLFGAAFTDSNEVDGVSDEVRKELEERTPGFDAWQQEQWLGCCGDAAAFLGLAGKLELERDFPDAVPVVKKYVRREFELSKEDAEELYDGLSKDGEPTAYVFRCLQCKKFVVSVDQT